MTLAGGSERADCIHKYVCKLAGTRIPWPCMDMLFQHNTLDQVANDVILCKGTDCTFNKQSGNLWVTSSSSTAWNDTVRGADVGLVTERIKVTSSYSGERHT